MEVSYPLVFGCESELESRFVLLYRTGNEVDEVISVGVLPRVWRT